MKSLIIVDIQPLYHHAHMDITPELLKYINKNFNKYDNILWFFNSTDSEIDESIIDLKEYIYDFEILNKKRYDDIIFIDKYYAFFRNWMDCGVDIEFIKYVIRFMVKQNVLDSIYLSEDDFKMLVENYYDLSYDDFKEDYTTEYDCITNENIHIPNFKWERIKKLKNVDICGGGKNKCLLEMKILLESIGVNVNVLLKFTYR